MLVKLWILPLLVSPARVVFPSPAVVRKLRTVYQIAVKSKSWATILNILSHPASRRGYSLAPPETFLYWQHAFAFVAYLKDPLSVPKVLGLGILFLLASLPFFQIGSNVIKNNMPYLGWCARAFSLVKIDISIQKPALLSYDTPLWHSTLSLND